MDCKLKYLDGFKEPNSWINNLLQIRVKILRPGKRRMKFIKNRIFHGIIGRKPNTLNGVDQKSIVPGDIVRVRSKKEIRSLLDDHEKYMGCLFIDEMYEHCNKTYKVVKEMKCFYDEAKQKMVKTKGIFALEGVLCSGRQRLYSVSCDRCCFFFWHKDWLEKG